jgi:branched-chain amino acid transport system substrate-binding protein
MLAATVQLAACGVLWTACADPGAETQTVRFGLAAPLEQYLGSHALRGAELARDRINAEGGIRGHQLELRAVSDSADPQRAVRVADSFFSDPSIVAVIGHVNSGATLAAAPIYGRGLVAMSPSATSPEVSRAGPWIFRVTSSDAANSAWLARFVARELGDRAVVFYANEPYGRGLREGFARTYTAAGGTLLEEYPYIEGRTDSFEPYLLGMRETEPDVIFIAGLDMAAGRIIREARALGVQAPILGGDGLMGLIGQDRVYDGTYVGLLYHPEATTGAGEGFVAAYEQRYGEPPDHFAALAYDAVMLAAEAATEAGFERQAIRDYLGTVGHSRPPFSGVTGRIAFDDNGDPVGKAYGVGRIQGNVIELVSVEGGT